MANDRIGYCEPTDLYISGTRLSGSAGVTPTDVINAASDEIDSEIGSLYSTPILVDYSDEDKRDDTLLLKNICASLATGRLITSMSAGNQDNKMHAYGEYLIKFAYVRIREIKTGARDLTSADKKVTPDEDLSRKGPKLFGTDDRSHVDDFYDNMTPPQGLGGQNWNGGAYGNWPFNV